MSPRSAGIVLLGTVLGSAASIAAQDPAGSALTSVRLDAIAADGRGAPVATLTSRDFEVREDGRPVVLDRVRFISNAPRLIAVYLDEYQITAGENADRARAALIAFIDRDLRPDDRLVVLKPLDSLFTIRLTDDHARARAIVAGLEGRRGDYAPRTPYEETFMIGSAARIEAVRSQIALSALNALAVHLGTLDAGRKTMFVVTEALGETTRHRGQEFLATRETIVRSANRGNVSIYPIDPRPGVAAGDPSRADTAPLPSLARETDGSLVAAADSVEGLAAGIGLAAADAAGYYVLEYTSASTDDGGFQPVQVRVTRAGVKIRARRGYWTPSKNDRLGAALLADANRPATVIPPEPARRNSPLIRPWFGLALAGNDTMQVTFVWEPPSSVPGDQVRVAASRVELTVLGEDDRVLFEGPVRPTGPGVLDSAGRESARAVFPAEPGRLRLRMKIEDAERRQVDSDVRDIIVRDLRGRVAIATPEFLRARNFREFRTLAEPTAVPVSSREFRRTERLLIRFGAHAPDGEQPLVTARLLNRNGQQMRTLDVRSDGARREVDLTLAALASGEYHLELSATTPSGDAKEVLGFRVTN